MKNKKLFLAGVAAVSAASAVAPLATLTACGNNAENQLEIAYDEEYGVDNFTYTTLEKQFVKLVNNKIDADDEIPEDRKKLEKDRVHEDLNTFRSQISEIQSSNPALSKSAYTAVSNALIEHAQDEYGIRLNRNTKAQWSDIEEMYTGLKNSWKANLQASGISGDKLANIMEDVEANYRKTVTNLTEKYTDPLSAFIKAKSELPVIFAAVNSEIAYFAAGQVLSQFTSDYIIEYKDKETNNKLDQLENSESVFDEELGTSVSFAKGNDITVFMNRIFTIRNAKTGKEVPGGFNRHIIPGYRISPVLNSINHINAENEHSIGISWECVKDTYKIDSDEAKKATYFHVNVNDETLNDYITPRENDENSFSIQEFAQQNNDNRFEVKYEIPLTQEAEKKALEDTYQSTKTASSNEDQGIFGYLKISFNKSSDKNFYDAFRMGRRVIPNNAQDDHEYFVVNGYNLGAAGAQMSISLDQSSADKYDLSDMYDTANEIAVNPKTGKEGIKFNSLPGLLKMFAKSCDISAIAEIWTENGETQVKINDAKILFRNGSETEVSIREKIDTAGIKWAISKNAWRNVLDSYASISGLYDQYENNKFEQDLKSMRKQKILRDAFLSVTVIVDTFFVLSAIGPFSTPAEKFYCIFFVTLSLADAGCEIASYYLFRHYKYDIVKDYANRTNDKIKSQPEFVAMREQLKSDKEKYHILEARVVNNPNGDEEHVISEEDFLKQYDQYYKNMSNEDYSVVDLHYNRSSEDMAFQAFNMLLKREDLDLEGYTEKLSEWNEGKKYAVIVKRLNITAGVLLGAQILVGLLWGVIAPVVNKLVDSKLLIELEKKSSESLLKKAFDWIDKHFRSLVGLTAKAERMAPAKVAVNATETGAFVPASKEGIELTNKGLANFNKQAAKIPTKGVPQAGEATTEQYIKTGFNGSASRVPGSNAIKNKFTKAGQAIEKRGLYASGEEVIKSVNKLDFALVNSGKSLTESKQEALSLLIKESVFDSVQEAGYKLPIIINGQLSYEKTTLQELEYAARSGSVAGSVFEKETASEVINWYKDFINLSVEKSRAAIAAAQGSIRTEKDIQTMLTLYKDSIAPAERSITNLIKGLKLVGRTPGYIWTRVGEGVKSFITFVHI